MLTLTSDGETKTAAAWRIRNITRTLQSQATDTVTFETPSADILDDPTFPIRTEVTLTLDDTPYFTGRVTDIQRNGGPGGDTHTYVISGPWDYLENLVYMVDWKSAAGSPASFSVVPTSHLLLFRNSSGLITTGAQIIAIVDYAIARGVPIQRGQITPDLQVPIDEAQDITCAEAIRRALRWSPDAVAWFDYTTTPPTFHCRLQSELTPITHALVDPEEDEQTTAIRDIQIAPRYNLQRSAVAIHYEVTTTIDGNPYLNIVKDVAPGGATGQELDALSATVALQGPTINRVYGTVQTATIQTGSQTWWLAKKPELKAIFDQSKLTNLSITNVTIRDEAGQTSTLPYELTGGQIAPWMLVAGAPATTQRLTISADLKYKIIGPNNQVSKDVHTEKIHVNLVATNLPGGSYSTVGESDTGDPMPVGLAAKLYASLGPLKYAGSLTIQPKGFSPQTPIGRTINIANGRPEWADMAALVQTSSQHVDSGTTQITFGPPSHIGIPDLIELLKATRYRRRFTLSSVQDTGSQGSSGIALGNHTPNTYADKGGELKAREQYYSTSGGRTNQTWIISDPPEVRLEDGTTGKVVVLLSDAKAKEVRLREVDICIGDQQKKIILLASEPYTP